MKDLLRPAYYAGKDIIDFKGRKRLKKNIVLHDLYVGERAFLLLTGASLQQIDVKKLHEEYTFGTGFIFLHEDIGKINPHFYSNMEPAKSFCPSNPNWPKSHLGPLGPEGIVAFYGEIDKRLTDKTMLIMHSDNHRYIEKNSLFAQNTVYYLKGKKRLHVPPEVPYRSIADLTRRRISGGGIAFFSILIMMYMGFKDIYLCGAGYTYDPVYAYHFYDTPVWSNSMGRDRAEMEAKKAISERGSRIEYYDLFEKDNLYRSIYVIRSGFGPYRDTHRRLNDYAKSQGVTIFNIVPDGFDSPIYEKITWEEVRSRILSENPR